MKKADRNVPWMVAACALWPVTLVGSSPATPPRNVVLIGWDGCQRDHLKEMIGRSEVPNLMSLAQEGRLVDIDITTGATDTKAGWSQILTGYAPEKSGVFSNRRFQPIPRGYSVFERLEDHFGAAHIDTVALIAKKGHVDNDGSHRIPYARWLAQQKKQRRIDKAKPGRGDVQGGQIVAKNGRTFVEVPAKPWFHASKTMDLFENGLKTTERVGQRALEELEKRRDQRFFFFIHFSDPDHPGHQHGENAREYTTSIQNDDAWTGRIIAKLKELGLYEQTLVYVTADHGFNEGETGHRYAPYVFLGTNDRQVTRDGDRMDIAPTILARFGLDLGKLQPSLDGTPLNLPAPRHPAPPEPPSSTARKPRKGKP